MVEKDLDREYREYLNDIFSIDPYLQSRTVMYLTNKERSEHISEDELIDACANRGMGDMLKRLDPTAYNVGFREWVEENGY